MLFYITEFVVLHRASGVTTEVFRTAEQLRIPTIRAMDPAIPPPRRFN